MQLKAIQFKIILALCLFLGTTSHAEIGVTDSEIKIGTMNSDSGPEANLGLELNAGAKVHFNRINAKGGI